MSDFCLINSSAAFACRYLVGEYIVINMYITL